MKPNYIFPFLWLRDQSKEKLKTEIKKISECGIRSICVESRPHPDFGGPGWWSDLDLILDEAQKLDMKVWILDDAHFPTGQANALLAEKYPERARKYLMLKHTDCVGPIAQATLDINLLMTKAFTWLDFGKPVNKPLMEKQELLSVVAVSVIEKDTIGNEAVNLADFVKEGLLRWDVPGGVWRICVSFITYDFGARNDYINYIDSESAEVQIEAIYEMHYQHYADKFGNTIAGFFSDEPGFYNVDNYNMEDAIGRKKMPLPWCGEFPGLMEEKAGSDWKTKIPYIWFNSEDYESSCKMRNWYMDIVSFLYQKNFSDKLGKWCEEHQVKYIGHVIEDNDEHSRLGCGAGHFFRAMSGQHMAGIDTIGGQIIPGNPYAGRHGPAYVGNGYFYHFVLAKLGASAAQTDPKKKGRLLCEAFGAYGWSLGVKSMKWIVDYLLIQGVNHFVPHAFSMADYPDDDCPPHFYAGGHNAQFPYFAEVMKYTNQMCDLLSNGKNVPVVGLLYPAEQDWMNACMGLEVPARELMEHQIDFEILPLDVFRKPDYYGTRLHQGKFTVNERDMQALIIPESKYMDNQVVLVAEQLRKADILVIFVNQVPEHVVSVTNSRCNVTEVLYNCTVISQDQLAFELRKQNKKDIVLDKECRNLFYYHYKKEQDIYMFFNTSLNEKVETEITFKEQRKVAVFEVQTGEYKAIPFTADGDTTKLKIKLLPYESIVLIFGENTETRMQDKKQEISGYMDISHSWYITKTTAVNYPNFPECKFKEILEPISNEDFYFSGVIKYSKEVKLPKVSNVWFEAQYLYEAAEVFVNGMSAGKKVTPPYRFDLSGLCVNGDNKISVEAVNTPVRDTLKNPGIFGAPREVLEPSGMFGKIVLEWN